MAAITALTAQNTLGVDAIHLPPPAFVRQQIETIFADIDVAAIKVGMLGSAAIVEAVVGALRDRRGVPIVVDPVLASTSGAILGDASVVDAMWKHLFPLATLITPNLGEAARLASSEIAQQRDAIEAAAQHLHRRVETAWLLKGGDADSETADDLLFDGKVAWLSSPRIETRNTHGTGCTLSSAIAARLAQGAKLAEAVADAKAYVDLALSRADGLSVGRGHGPLDHFARWR